MGYTREKFAEKLDVSVSYLAELERGRTGISVKMLIKVCNVLGLSADYVLFGTERTALYVILWLLQALFYLAGSLGYYLSMRRTKNKLLFVPCYFLFMNLNVLRGMAYLSTRNDKEKGTWEKARRA